MTKSVKTPITKSNLKTEAKVGKGNTRGNE